MRSSLTGLGTAMRQSHWPPRCPVAISGKREIAAAALITCLASATYMPLPDKASGRTFEASTLKAVWSFWSKPFRSHHHRVWTSEKEHLLAWVLSTQTARQHYGPTELHTDDAGARMLIDGIGLEFDRV